MSIATGVPALTPDEAAHGAQVEARLRAEIARAGGWIGFARYMELALYAPGLGYYSAGASKLGAAGDFVTAPELAPLFGRCLAVQCEEVLRTLGGGDLLELGAGSGAMAATLLAELARRDALPRRYRILDVSADLRERQHAAIAAAVPGLADRVEWLDRPPGDFTGVIVANEVLDALPVERFVMRGGEVASLGVAVREGRLAWCEGPASERLVQAVRHIERDTGAAWPEGYLSEVNLDLGPWLGAIAAALARGVMLFVDYGLPRREYYSPERSEGTLLCHFRHRFHEDPFARPGLQDIAAWVDFTAVAEAGLAAGLDLAGYTTQAHFLLGSGLDGFLAEAAGLGVVPRAQLSRQAMLLTLPGEMGERFKVVAFSRAYGARLRGFELRDLRHTL